MANITRIYSDIDFTFTRKPVVGDVALSYDEMAVIRSVRNILSTKNYERPFNPNLGSKINALLFENFSPIISASLETEIKTVINNYEPRASVNYITVAPDPDRNSYNVTLSFYIENASQPTTVSLILERNR